MLYICVGFRLLAHETYDLPISSWEKNNCCYKVSKCTKWQLFHSKWSKLSFWVKIVVMLLITLICQKAIPINAHRFVLKMEVIDRNNCLMVCFCFFCMYTYGKFLTNTLLTIASFRIRVLGSPKKILGGTAIAHSAQKYRKSCSSYFRIYFINCAL